MSAPGWAQLSGESVLKAAFLYHFAKFVEWPEEALPRESDPFTICVIGEPRMAEAASQFVKDKQIHGRTVVARAATSVTDIEGCHLLFVDATVRQMEKLRAISDSTSPVLTVGESDRFLSHGGMIKLFVEDGKLRFAISPQAAERAQLKISSKLLALGKITGRP
ncbi:MAG: YfiR family protein [Nitrospira sp.]|nr:YfiR family protein [Nitrospira sp.]